MKSAAVNADEAVKNGEFCIKNEELRIKKESFCIKNETRIGSASPSEKWTLQSCCDRTAKKPDKIDVRFENERRFFNRNQDADDRKSLFLPRKIMIWGDQVRPLKLEFAKMTGSAGIRRSVLLRILIKMACFFSRKRH